MTYLGYLIQVRGYSRLDDGVVAEITAGDGEHVAIVDSDRFSAEAAAREIVDYASCRGLALHAALQRVLH